MYSKITRIAFLGLFLLFISNFIANSQNLITNGTFDNGLTGWTAIDYTAGALTSIAANMGNNYVSMHHDKGGAMDVGDWNAIGQDVRSKFTIGKTYVLTFRYKTEIRQDSVLLDTKFGDATLFAHSSFIGNGPILLITDGQWHDYSIKFTVSPTFPAASEPMVAFYYEYKSSGNIYLDDISIYQNDLKVITPSGGEKWYVGTNQTVTWEGNTGNLILQYSTNSGKNWIDINTDVSGSNYNWPVIKPASSFCKVKITDKSNPLISAVSDNLFSIIDKGNTKFPVTLTVPSDGSIIYFPTDSGCRYRISVRGTYTMWSRPKDKITNDSCYGVDAAYIYDVPQKTIDNVEWPSTLAYPQWVGVEQTYTINGVLSINMRDYVGFRINGVPLNSSGFQSSTHQYEVDRLSNGEQFVFQILDSVYLNSQKAVVPEYNDNCGELTITIDKLSCPGDTGNIVPEICSTTIIYDKKDPKKPIGILLKAAIWVLDSTSVVGKTNVLKDISITKDCAKLGIVMDGHFICPIDSVVCQSSDTITSSSVAVGLLIDRTGSMSQTIDSNTTDIRMDASQNAVKKFISMMENKNRAFVMSFDTATTLNQDWTTDSVKLDKAVDALYPYGFTSVYKAIITAHRKVSLETTSKKALIVLSDGADTHPDEFFSTNIMNIVSNNDVRIYVIALGYTSEVADSLGRARLEMIAKASGGKLFSVYDSKALELIYQNLAIEIKSDECCGIYFHANDICDSNVNREHFIRLIYAPKDTIIVSTVINYKCPLPYYTDVLTEDYTQANDVNIFPNPINHQGTMVIKIDKPSSVEVKISDMLGNQIMTEKKEYAEPGNYVCLIDGSKIQGGTYFVTILIDGEQMSRKIVVVH